MDADKAYGDGRQAFEGGASMHDNPYTPLSPDWHDWQRGFGDASEDGW
jgi:hypothetical protein